MRKEKENAKQYNKIPHYIKIEKRSGGKYHTCTEKQRTQEKTCIKLHVFKPIYKYKKNHVRAGGSYSDGYSEYRLRGIPSIVVFCLFYKMTYDILFHTLSASKMSSTSYNSTKKGREKKKKKKKSSQFHKEKLVALRQPSQNFTASVPSQNIYRV